MAAKKATAQKNEGRSRSTPARARARSRDPEDRAEAAKLKADRISHIREMLETGRWMPGDSEREHAGEWGISRATVRHYAAEARRKAQELFTEEERIEQQAVVARRYEAIIASALSAKKVVIDSAGSEHEIPAPDYRAAIQANAGYAQLLGLDRVQPPVSLVAPGMDELDELEKRLRSLMASEQEPGGAQADPGGTDAGTSG